MTRGQMQDLLSQFALQNPQYREALVNDPRSIIEKQFNTEFPEGLDVKVVEDTADTAYVVVPYAPPADAELSDDDLERVAGGKQDIDAQCTSMGVSVGQVTVTQINL